MRHSADFLWRRAYLVARAEERRILDKSAIRETAPWAQFEGCMVAIRVGGGDLEGALGYLDRRRRRRRTARAFCRAALAARFGLAENVCWLNAIRRIELERKGTVPPFEGEFLRHMGLSIRFPYSPFEWRQLGRTPRKVVGIAPSHQQTAPIRLSRLA